MSDPTPPEAPSAADAERQREHVREVLRARARVLARPLAGAAGEQAEQMADLVTLDIDGTHYAIEATVVREVYAVREMTPLPTAPSFVLGITNIRGKIIAVLDLGAVLGHGALTEPSGRAVIVEIGGIEIGVDARHCGVARIPQRRMAPASREARSRYLKAVGNDEVGVLDLERIIADTRQTAASLASGAAQ